MSKEQLEEIPITADGTRASHLRSCKRSIACMMEAFNLDRGDLMGIVNEVLQEQENK